MEHKDGEDDRAGPILDLRLKRSKEEERFLWSTLSTARIASGGVQRLTSLVSSEKPHVPSSMAYILYALLTRHPHASHLSTPDLYLLPKKKKKQPLGWYHASHSLSPYLPPHPCITSLFLSFYLNSWYARGRECVVVIRWCAAPSLCSGWRAIIRAQGGGRAMPRYPALCYACSMWWPLWKCRDNGKGLLASRGGLDVFKRGPDWMYTTYPHTKSPSNQY